MPTQLLCYVPGRASDLLSNLLGVLVPARHGGIVSDDATNYAEERPRGFFAAPMHLVVADERFDATVHGGEQHAHDRLFSF